MAMRQPGIIAMPGSDFTRIHQFISTRHNAERPEPNEG